MRRSIRLATDMRIARFNRDRNIFFGVGIAGTVAGGMMLATAEVSWAVAAFCICVLMVLALRYLMPCRHCGESMLWWSARHTRSWDLFGAIDRLDECPYCAKPLVE